MICFFITQSEYLQSGQSSFLRQLPANNIIIDSRLQLSEEAKQAFFLKNVQFIDFESEQDLAKQLNEEFYNDQLGYKYKFDNIQFDSFFKSTVKQLGHNYLEIIDNDIKDYQ